ncbi:MAG: type II toxin-antitoxin system VapC family toxin [Acidimicrobiia bacterium]|nr:type II toxin-antitoxin system VapC family toxin [Acidimicrobiia bacterium]
MTWYLDTSAFVKLVREEAESTSLRQWISGRDVCSSDLLRTEARRAFAGDVDFIHVILDDLLGTIPLIRLTPDVFDEAGHLRSVAALRSLDAIHIVAAGRLNADLEGIATYDHRMVAAATELGVAVAAPTG